MKKEHTPEARREARTVFRLDEAEVIEALLAYVASKGEEVPDGVVGVWVRDGSEFRTEERDLATLVIDHRIGG